MNLKECFEASGSKFPFTVTKDSWTKVEFFLVEAKLTNGHYVGTIGDKWNKWCCEDSPEDCGFILVQPEKRHVFRWELRSGTNPQHWRQYDAFLTETDAAKYLVAHEYRKSRLHSDGTYPKDGWVDE